MFTKRQKSKSKLDQTIDVLLTDMIAEPYVPEDFAKQSATLSVLYKLREIEDRSRPSMDTMLIVGANILGIVIIVGYEHAHVVTSKAAAFIMRLK